MRKEPLTKERLLNNVFFSPDGCWYWLGALSGGYARIGSNGKNLIASRVSYELFKGSLNGLLVLHRCDNPACINPDHLFLGNQDDNMKDMTRKGRHNNGSNKKRTMCNRKLHPMTPDNTYVHTNKKGREYRLCKMCNREYYRIRNLNKRLNALR